MYLDPHRYVRLLVLASITTLLACPSKTTPVDGNNQTNNTKNNTNNVKNNAKNNTTNNMTPPTPVVAPSERPRVQFKGQRRWGTDLSRSLELERSELCKELSEYDCLERVHRIALGGVEPYNLGIDEPLPVAPVTAPIAADRVAFAACDTRAEQDLQDTSAAIIFKEMPASGAPDTDARTAMSHRLYERILNREATDDEVQHLVAFWDEIAQEKPEDPRREWATLTCFALATSLESLFY